MTRARQMIELRGIGLTASKARSVSCRWAGFWASGQLESFTQMVRVRRET